MAAQRQLREVEWRLPLLTQGVLMPEQARQVSSPIAALPPAVPTGLTLAGRALGLLLPISPLVPRPVLLTHPPVPRRGHTPPRLPLRTVRPILRIVVAAHPLPIHLQVVAARVPTLAGQAAALRHAAIPLRPAGVTLVARLSALAVARGASAVAPARVAALVVAADVLVRVPRAVCF